ncbi:MAG: TraR/DksA family transcriptional regulator [Acidobacteria bacterium]|nr:TraR/DksA family transcriptional regulator [Acidobacteriota bacterium]
MNKPTVVMRDHSLETYRRVLLSKKAETLVALGINIKRLAETRPEPGEDPEYFVHEEVLRLRVNRVLDGQLRQLESAIDRLESGDYGTCVDCGAPIPAKRLRAIPWAVYCVACQEQKIAA